MILIYTIRGSTSLGRGMPPVYPQRLYSVGCLANTRAPKQDDDCGICLCQTCEPRRPYSPVNPIRPFAETTYSLRSPHANPKHNPERLINGWSPSRTTHSTLNSPSRTLNPKHPNSENLSSKPLNILTHSGVQVVLRFGQERLHCFQAAYRAFRV